jgi:hypothetical protein
MLRLGRNDGSDFGLSMNATTGYLTVTNGIGTTVRKSIGGLDANFTGTIIGKLIAKNSSNGVLTGLTIENPYNGSAADEAIDFYGTNVEGSRYQFGSIRATRWDTTATTTGNFGQLEFYAVSHNNPTFVNTKPMIYDPNGKLSAPSIGATNTLQAGTSPTVGMHSTNNASVTPQDSVFTHGLWANDANDLHIRVATTTSKITDFALFSSAFGGQSSMGVGFSTKLNPYDVKQSTFAVVNQNMSGGGGYPNVTTQRIYGAPNQYKNLTEWMSNSTQIVASISINGTMTATAYSNSTGSNGITGNFNYANTTGGVCTQSFSQGLLMSTTGCN